MLQMAADVASNCTIPGELTIDQPLEWPETIVVIEKDGLLELELNLKVLECSNAETVFIDTCNGSGLIKSNLVECAREKGYELPFLPYKRHGMSLIAIVLAFQKIRLLRNQNRVKKFDFDFNCVLNDKKLVHDLSNVFVICETCSVLSYSNELTKDAIHLSIEIKPKWLFMGKNIDGTNSNKKLIKDNVCRYCLHRNYKRRYKYNGKSLSDRLSEHSCIKSNDKYCPLKLVDDDISKSDLKTAINQLIVEPWNNLRILGSNISISTIGNDKVELLANVLTELIYDKSSKLNRTLKSIKYIQEELHNSFSNILDIIDLEPSNENRLKLDLIINKLLKLSVHERFNKEKESLLWLFRKKSIINESLEMEYKVLLYMISASIKDCSLIVRIDKKPESSKLNCDINIIDFDIKSFNKLETYNKLENKLIECFLNN